MRVIAGTFKGRRLKGSNDLSIRPTTDRVKEYIFNILQTFPKEKTVIDIFSGSGALGIEALSRGAGHVFFVEKAPLSLRILQQNLNNIHLSSKKFTILHKEALAFVKTTSEKADLCFMDPPYVYPPLQKLVDHFFERHILHEGGILMVEHEILNPLEAESPRYHIFSQKQMSRSIISFLEEKVNK